MKARRFIYRMAAGLFAGVAIQSFAGLISVQTKPVELWPREWGMHVLIESTAVAQMTGLQCTGGNLTYPVILQTDPNYKTYRDALMLAYTLKGNVRLFFDTAKPCWNGQFPYIYAIDVLAQP
jgi:hypothetical protein